MTLPIVRSAQLALREAATSWLEQDPDAVTRAELQQLLDAAGELLPAGEQLAESDTSQAAEAWRELRDRFASRLQFGTAGLRGRQGAGSNRMNRVVVAQAAAGLARYLLAANPNPSVVIGYDARINSDVYARDTAEIMAGAGVRVTLLPRPLPTPVTAFAVRHLTASAGVMVTASHNPKWDNGYKVYLGGADGGSQIVPPADAQIAAQIDHVATHFRVPELARSDAFTLADEQVVDAYVAATARVLRQPVADTVRVAYTPLHGVGWETFHRVLTRAGVSEPVLVTEQLTPDGTFPTLDFPNPEEPGALDLAYATATAAGATLLLAHDPDADRLAVAQADGAGGWHLFGGNDIGKLLGWRAAELAKAGGASGTLATSLVSSPALAAVAADTGLGYTETQTGFKWISRAEGILYGYEEALGYLVNPEVVHDKDGLSAALAVLDLVYQQAARGLTLLDLDDEFGQRFGVFASQQVSARLADTTQVTALMTQLREHAPTRVGEVTVSEVFDYETAAQPANILRLVLADGTRVMIRPSGTEPKLKAYIDAVAKEGPLEARRAAADARCQAAAAGMRALFA